MSSHTDLGRRQFLKASALGGGGLMLGVAFASRDSAAESDHLRRRQYRHAALYPINTACLEIPKSPIKDIIPNPPTAATPIFGVADLVQF